MARFDVYRLRVGPGYVVDCQANLLNNLKTRFVVPLTPVSSAPPAARRLNPLFDIDGEPHAMVTQFAASIPVKELGEKVCSLEEHDMAIMNALDMLITGY